MKRLTKLLLFLILTPIAVLIVAVVVALMFLDAAAKQGIQRGATYALGVDTTLNDVDIGVFSGRVSLNGLQVDNPEGFKAERFLALGDGRVAVSLASLTKDTIEVPTLALDTIEVNLERREGASNYQVILDNLEKLGGLSKPEPKPSEKGGKRLIIGELTIRNVTINADMLGAGGIAGELTRVTVPISEIKLKNVGQTGSGVGGTGVTVSELAGIVVQAVLAAAAEKGGDILGPLAGELKSAVANLGDLQQLGVEVVGKAGEQAQQIGKDLTRAAEGIQKEVEGVGKELQKGLEGVGEGLKELFPRK